MRFFFATRASLVCHLGLLIDTTIVLIVVAVVYCLRCSQDIADLVSFRLVVLRFVAAQWIVVTSAIVCVEAANVTALVLWCCLRVDFGHFLAPLVFVDTLHRTQDAHNVVVLLARTLLHSTVDVI